MKRSDFKSVEEYINTFPTETQKKLRTIRQTIKSVVPENTTEKISYQIPTFTFHGNLIHYAAFEHHFSLYPGAAPIEHFKNKLKDYQTAKGTIQFPSDKPLPVEIIKEITQYCVKARMEKLK